MELKTAIETLEYYQEWRLGKREDMIHYPKKITEALDIVLSEVKRTHLGQSEQLPCDHEFIHKPLGGNVYCWKCCALQTK